MASGPARLTLNLILGALLTGSLALAGGGQADAAHPSPAPAAAGGDQAIDMLVLGDSYSAGNGATDDQGNEQYYGPADCYRSRVDWGEKYAATLRAGGQAVNLVNHACSGGVTADFTNPRVMDTSTAQTEATPAGVTTNDQANASLAATDPCNTHQFPDEEFWTYNATVVVPGLTTTYDCTRNIRPQANFITPQTDLVLFTMGGNDIHFSTIVTDCFILKNGTTCKQDIDAARALLPTVQQRLLAALAYMRAHGLRDDAKVVQLGYPLLQVDNNYTLPNGYPAGNEIRSFGLAGNASVAAALPAANAGHPGQVSFLTGVPEKFAGHEPDASTPAGNPARWINQLDGTNPSFFYHPNRLGQTAYAELLATHGTFDAPTSPTSSSVRAKLRVRYHPHRLGNGDRIRLVVKVRLSNGDDPRGKIQVRGLPGHHRLATKRLRGKDHGRVRIVVRVHSSKVHRIRVIYRDKTADVVKTTHRVRKA